MLVRLTPNCIAVFFYTNLGMHDAFLSFQAGTFNEYRMFHLNKKEKELKANIFKLYCLEINT